jgi:hypothetical protein
MPVLQGFAAAPLWRHAAPKFRSYHTEQLALHPKSTSMMSSSFSPSFSCSASRIEVAEFDVG